MNNGYPYDGIQALAAAEQLDFNNALGVHRDVMRDKSQFGLWKHFPPDANFATAAQIPVNTVPKGFCGVLGTPKMPRIGGKFPPLIFAPPLFSITFPLCSSSNRFLIPPAPCLEESPQAGTFRPPFPFRLRSRQVKAQPLPFRPPSMPRPLLQSLPWEASLVKHGPDGGPRPPRFGGWVPASAGSRFPAPPLPARVRARAQAAR